MKTSSTNKVAVVTGAGGTLCSEMARQLAAQNIKVALMGRSLDSLQQVEKEIKDLGGTAISVAADVTDYEALKRAHGIINKELGPCSILINGAGGNQMDAITTINEFDQEELNGQEEVRGFFNLNMQSFGQVVNINSMGTVIPCQIFGNDMAKSGGGCIINIGSMNSYKPLSRVAAYAMAKAGVINFTQWLAAYLAPANIRVNAIAPGFFLNDKNIKRLTTEDGGYTERGGGVIRQTPMKRFGAPKDLVGCMNWLIDDDASAFVTGITIPIDGGFIACAGV